LIGQQGKGYNIPGPDQYDTVNNMRDQKKTPQIKFGGAKRVTGAPITGQKNFPGPAEYGYNRMFDHKQMIKYKPFGGLHQSATGFGNKR
jgi:hypothetical protein